MTLRRFSVVAAALGALALSGAAVAADTAPPPGKVLASPVARLPFPERGYVIGVGESIELETARVVVRENGLAVDDVRIDPLGGSGLRFGVVLAVDASESMTGAPAAAALEASRAFVSQRTVNQAMGIVAFNGGISVLQTPTRNTATLRRTLAAQPPLAYGTRINDALLRSLELLRSARLSSGSVVLFSDGADVGSRASLAAAVEAAKKQQVRVFTVGLRSKAFEPTQLVAIAEQTGGTFVEARSASELASIFEELGQRLAGEYLVRYRSAARPRTEVDVSIEVPGIGKAASSYVAPTPSLLPPYHRSFASRFLLSPASPLLLSIFVGAALCLLLVVVARRPRSNVVERVRGFAAGPRTAPREPGIGDVLAGPMRAQPKPGWWRALERDLELARMSATPERVVTMTVAGALGALVLAVLIGVPVIALLALASPLLARTVIRHKLKAVRNAFADQFPANLQVLASALRSGNSFNGALGVVVDNAHEPARSELARVLQDDRLGVLPEEAIRKLAGRMANRDVEQVALLAELQRTTGGNSAEILDTVVATIRERADLRRLVMTLTAQGRMARWILTALPAVGAGIMWLLQPQVMVNFFTSSGGQVALAVAVALVAAGSLVIQRIVDIEL